MPDLRALAEAARQASDFVHPDHWDTLFVFQNAANPTVVLALLDVVEAALRVRDVGNVRPFREVAMDTLCAALARASEVMGE